MNRKLLVTILILAFILRFYKLGQNPPSLNWDEASNAYNAYSILKTGRDEYERFLPLYNRSFDDYKPPLYMYLNIPTVAIFGLTPFAARLPSALFGTLTVLLVYLLTKKLFVNSKYHFSLFTFHFSLAHVSALMLAVSPWHLQVSRVGFEANVGLFLTVAAFTSLLYGLPDNGLKFSRKKVFLTLISAVFLGLSMYAYHAQRIFIPLMFIAWILIFHKKVFSISLRLIITFLIIVGAMILPLFVLTPREAFSQRFKSISNTGVTFDLEKSVKYLQEDQSQNFSFGKIIHNRRIILVQSYLKNYLANFDPNFLFVRGDENSRHHIEKMGLLYLFELPLMLMGIYWLIGEHNKEAFFIFSWLLISPVAALASDTSPHALRSLTMVIPLEIISAYSFMKLINLTKAKNLFLITSSVIFVISVSVYLHNYYTHYPTDSAQSWQYGYKEAAIKSDQLKNDYDKILVSGNFEQAYIFWLFNLKYDPATYQKLGSKNHFDKFYFNSKQPTDPADLFVDSAKEFSKAFVLVETINYPDGSDAFQIGHPKPLENEKI